MRAASAGVVRTLLHPNILTGVASMIVYTLGIVLLLHLVHLWNMSHLKGTVIWFFFSGIVLTFSILTSRSDENIFLGVVKTNAKITIIIAFIINTYTLPLILELIIIPFLTLLVALDAVAKSDEEYSSVARLTTSVMTVAGLGYLFYAVYRAAIDYQHFLGVDSFKNLLLAPVLTFSFSPFIYLIVVVSKYEQIFVRLKQGPDKEKSLKRYAKWKILLHCKMSMSQINAFLSDGAMDLMRVQTKEDVDKMMAMRKN